MDEKDVVRLHRGNRCKCYLSRKAKDRLDLYFAANRYVWNYLLGLYLKRNGLYHYKPDEQVPSEEVFINHLGNPFKPEHKLNARDFARTRRYQIKDKYTRGEELSLPERALLLVADKTLLEHAAFSFSASVSFKENGFGRVLRRYRKNHPIEEGPPKKRLSGCPMFKRGDADEQSFTFDLSPEWWTNYVRIKGKDAYVTVPQSALCKDKPLKLFIKGVRDHVSDNGRVCSVTIKKEGKVYWCTLSWEFDKPEDLPPTGAIIGLDQNEMDESALDGEEIGRDIEKEEAKDAIRNVIAISGLGGEHPLTDEDINHIKDLYLLNKRDEAIVKQIQEKMAKMQGPIRADDKNGIPRFPGSNNYLRARWKKARLQRSIAERNRLIRLVHIHNAVKYHDVTLLENLEIQGKYGMLKGKGEYGKRGHNRRIYAMASYAFYQDLKAYCELTGRAFQRVAKDFASTQLCCICGEKNPEMKDTSIRIYRCIDPECPNHYSRDLNAANNIRKEGIRLYIENQDNLKKNEE